MHGEEIQEIKKVNRIRENTLEQQIIDFEHSTADMSTLSGGLGKG